MLFHHAHFEKSGGVAKNLWRKVIPQVTQFHAMFGFKHEQPVLGIVAYWEPTHSGTTEVSECSSKTAPCTCVQWYNPQVNKGMSNQQQSLLIQEWVQLMLKI